MAITTDFKVYPDSKVIRYVGNNDNVYTCAAFYSYLQNLFDEPGYMSYQKPIKYNTPTSYTMLNGWFLDNGDPGSEDSGNILEHLYEGSINTSGYDTIDDPIYMMDVDTKVAAFVAADKDKRVRTNDTDDVGPLLAFKANYPDADTARCWFRDVNSVGLPGAAEDVDMSLDTGIGDYTNTGGGVAVSGDEVYANIYNIASWAGTPNAQVYIKQKHPVNTATDIRVLEWSNADNWDRGVTTTEAIDILLPVKLGGDPIDGGSFTLYGRQTGDTFTHTVSTVSTDDPSRTPIAMETSSDAVNLDDGSGTKKGEYYLLYYRSTTGFFSAGDIIQDVATTSTTPPSWYAEVIAVTEFTDTTTGLLTLGGLLGTITGDDTIYVGTVDSGNARGTPGGTYTEASAIGTQLTVGLTCTGGTSLAERVLKGVNDVASDYHYVFAVDEAITGSSKDVYYKDFTTEETITDSGSGTVTNQAASSTSIISDYTDVTIAHVNGSVTISNVSATAFEIGEVVNYTNPSASAICLTAAVTGTATMYLGNVDSANEPSATSVFTGASSTATADCDSVMTDDDEMDFNFSLQSVYLYGVVIEGGAVYYAGRTLEDIYAYLQFKCRDGETDVMYTSTGSAITEEEGQFYYTARSNYAVSKTAPFGTLAGGVFFGAQAVWIQGMDSSDDNSIKLTDQGGTLREPNISIIVTVSNTRIYDRVIVYLEDGATGLPDKDQYTIAVAGVAQSASSIEKTTATDFPNDTPSSGWVYVTDDSANEEHKYRFTTWSSESLNLATEVPGTIDSAPANGQQIIDTGVFASGVEIGDIVRRTSDHQWCYIIEIVDGNTANTTV